MELSYEEQRELHRRMRKAGFLGSIGGGAAGLVAGAELTRPAWRRVQQMRAGGRIPASAALFAGELGLVAGGSHLGRRAASRHAGRKYLRKREKRKYASEGMMHEQTLAAFQDELEKIAVADALVLGGGMGALAAGKGRREKGAVRGFAGGLAGGIGAGIPVAIITRNVPATALATIAGELGGGYLAGRTARKKGLSKKANAGDEILLAAFLDELDKLGFETEIEKDAFVGAALKAVGNVARNVGTQASTAVKDVASKVLPRGARAVQQTRPTPSAAVARRLQQAPSAPQGSAARTQSILSGVKSQKKLEGVASGARAADIQRKSQRLSTSIAHSRGQSVLTPGGLKPLYQE